MTSMTKKKAVLLAALVLTGGTGFSSKAHAGEPYCREYTERVSINGRTQNAYGTACLQEDGDWKIVVAARADKRDDGRNYAYREREYDRTRYVPVRVVTYERHRPRVIYVYDTPRHWKRYHKKRYDRDSRNRHDHLHHDKRSHKHDHR